MLAEHKQMTLDSCLVPRLAGEGDGKETMTFQTTPYNHVGTFSSISSQGGSFWGLWL